MIVNFKVHKINQDIYKLTQTLTLKKKKIQSYLNHTFQASFTFSFRYNMKSFRYNSHSALKHP